MKTLSIGAIYGAAELHLLTDRCARVSGAVVFDVSFDHSQDPSPHQRSLRPRSPFPRVSRVRVACSSEDHGETWLFVEREVDALRTMATAKSNLPDLSPAGILLSLLARK